MDNIDPYAMHLVSGPSYLYAGGNYAAPTGAYRDDQLYLIASDAGASDATYFHGESGEPDFNMQDENWPDVPTDVSVIMTNAVLTLSYPTSTVAYNLFGVWFDTSFFGLASEVSDDDPKDNIDFNWGMDCQATCECALAGDANDDGRITLADIIATVKFRLQRTWLATLLKQ